MSKTISYTSIIIGSIIVIFMFVTSKTYVQLGLAAILYPLLAYFILKVSEQGTQETPEATIQMPSRPVQTVQDSSLEQVEVADVDKRTFLKFLGAAGLSFFVFSILGRRVDSLLFGGRSQNGQTIQEANPMEGFKISEVADDGIISFYGFVNQESGWLIMRQDNDISSFRYAKGDSNFTSNWANRENLKYDYYSKLF